MTDEELTAFLRDLPFLRAPEAADRIEALTKERNALRSALNRIRPIPERILRGIPVRDLAETLAEADSALIKGESHE
jgi:hypothetical protein